jgi:hypothetical protein
MAYYYITHPDIPVKASVEAPTTEKARTVYLDYLERHRIVRRSQRQSLRPLMILKRMDSRDEILTDITLSYGMINDAPPPPTYIDATNVGVQEVISEPQTIVEQAPVAPAPAPKPMSPLAKLVLGSR